MNDVISVRLTTKEKAVSRAATRKDGKHKNGSCLL